MDFKNETILAIGEKKIKEYFFSYVGEIGWFKCEENVTKKELFYGENEINLDEIPSEILEYDNGFGICFWEGWVSFTDWSWIERFEYDGSEKWVYKKLPTLADI